MASGLILDYLGSGVIANRPASPDLYTGSLGLWYATDTDTLSAWDGSTWEDVSGGIGMTNPMTTAGDVIVGGASGTPQRVALGAYGQVLTSDGSTVGWSAPPGAPVVSLGGTAYDMGDLTPGAWHIFTSSSEVTITVEDESTEPVPDYAEYGIEAAGSGGVTLVEDNLAIIIPPKGGTIALEELDFAVLKHTGTDEYKLVGSTVAAP